MSACTCGTLSGAFYVDCSPRVGGIKSAQIKSSAASSTAYDIQVLPESSNYNSVMTFDKTKNVKYWTSDVSLGIGPMTDGAVDFVEGLPCVGDTGWDVILTLYSGATVTFHDCYVTSSTFASGTAKADGHTGTLAFQSISSDGPSVTDPTV